MKPKQIIVLAGILVFLVIGVAVKELHQPAELTEADFTSLELSIDEKTVGGVMIFKGDHKESIRLRRKEGGWTVDSLWSAKADPKKIQELFEVLSKIHAEIRANDASLFGDFGIQDDQAFHLRFLDNKGSELLHLLLGTHRADYKTLFVRKAGSDTVYLIQAGLFRSIGIFSEPETAVPQSDFWIDLSLFTFAPEEIRGMETRLMAEGEELLPARVLLSEGKAWEFTEKSLPFEIDSGKVEAFLESAATWKGNKVVDPKGEYGFDSPWWGMRVMKKKGRDVFLTIAHKKEEEKDSYYFQKSDSRLVFEISSYTAKRMNVDDSRFFKDNPLDVSLETVEEIQIHARSRDLTLRPRKESDKTVKDYVEALRTFQTVRLLRSKAHEGVVISPAPYRLTIFKKGAKEPLVLDFGTEPLADDINEYAAVRQGRGPVFSIFAQTFKALFEDLEALSPPRPSL